jgi:ABC-2 type transporter
VIGAIRIQRAPHGGRIPHRLRILQVIVLAEFKLKYAGSALGYLWSVIKPLALFTVLYLVFGRIFKLGDISAFYPLALLIGIVLFSFFSDSTNQGMVSLVHRESLLRRLRFPRMVIPTAATLTAAMTFGVNLLVVAGFVAWQGIVPQLDWLLLGPLLLELYLFTLGTALILITIFVSLRDMGASSWSSRRRHRSVPRGARSTRSSEHRPSDRHIVTRRDSTGDFVSQASFWKPRCVDQSSAWLKHAPFAFWLVEARIG